MFGRNSLLSHRMTPDTSQCSASAQPVLCCPRRVQLRRAGWPCFSSLYIYKELASLQKPSILWNYWPLLTHEFFRFCGWPGTQSSRWTRAEPGRVSLPRLQFSTYDLFIQARPVDPLQLSASLATRRLLPQSECNPRSDRPEPKDPDASLMVVLGLPRPGEAPRDYPDAPDDRGADHQTHMLRGTNHDGQAIPVG